MMDSLIERLSSIGLVPVVVLDDASQALPLAETLLASGCPCMEITFRTTAAAAAVSAIASHFPEMLLGAGTLLEPDQASRAHDAGAAFGVAPGFDPEVANRARAIGLPFVPGVSTASEMSRALALGGRLLKFFPAETLGGVKLLKALLGAFRHTGVRVMPTGGINADNIGSWLQIPEVAACGGSWVCEPKLIRSGDWREISRRTSEAVQSLRTFIATLA